MRPVNMFDDEHERARQGEQRWGSFIESVGGTGVGERKRGCVSSAQDSLSLGGGAMWDRLAGLVQAGRGALGLAHGEDGVGEPPLSSSSSSGGGGSGRRRSGLLAGGRVEWDMHDAVEARLAGLVARGMEEGVARRRAREGGVEVGSWPAMEAAFLEAYVGAYAGRWPDEGGMQARAGQPRAFAECLTLHLGERLAEVRARGAEAFANTRAGDGGAGGGEEATELAGAVEVAVRAAGVACRSRLNVIALADTGQFLGVAGALLNQVSQRRTRAAGPPAGVLERVEAELAGLLPRFFSLGSAPEGHAWMSRQFGAGGGPTPEAVEVAARAAEAGTVGAVLKAFQGELTRAERERGRDVGGSGSGGSGLSPLGVTLAHALGHALTSGEAPNAPVQALILGFGAIDMLLRLLGALPGDEAGWRRILHDEAGGASQVLVLRLLAQAVWKHPGSLAVCIQGEGAARIGATLVCLAVLDSASPPEPAPMPAGAGIAPAVRTRSLLREAFQVMGAFSHSMGLDSLAAVRAGGAEEARKRAKGPEHVATGLFVRGIMYAFRGSGGGGCGAEVGARRSLLAACTLQMMALKFLGEAVARRPLSLLLFREAGVWDGWMIGPWVYAHPEAAATGLRAEADRFCDACLREVYLMGPAFSADESPAEAASLVYALGRYAEADIEALSSLQRCITGTLMSLGAISETACSDLVHALLRVGVLESVAKILCDLRGRAATPQKDPMLDLAYHCTFELVECILKPALGSSTANPLRLVISCETFIAELVELLPSPDGERADFALRALVALVHLEPGAAEAEAEAHSQFLMRYLQALPLAMSSDTEGWCDVTASEGAEVDGKRLARQSSSQAHRLSVSMVLLRGIQEALVDNRRSQATIAKIQCALADLDAQTFILNLLTRARFHPDPNLVCVEVVTTLMMLSRGNAEVNSAFYMCGGYQALETGLSETFSVPVDDGGLRLGQNVVKSLLDLIVEEQVAPLAPAQQPLSIRNEHAVPLFLRVLRNCQSSLGTKRLQDALDSFSAIALRNNGNRSSCARFGLMGIVLDWLEDVDDADLVDRLLKLFREVGGHSLGAQDLRRIVDSLKRANGVWLPSADNDGQAVAALATLRINVDRASKMMRVLQQMVHSSSQPDVYFDFSGGSASGIFIAEYKSLSSPAGGPLWPMWPSAAKGYSIAIWFRVEDLPETDGAKPKSVCLASFCTAKGENGFELVLRNKGPRRGGIILALCTVKSGVHEACAEFDYSFAARRWYFVCVTHAASMTRLLPTEVKLYVDGALAHADKLRYPRMGEPMTQCSFGACARVLGTPSVDSPSPFYGQAEGMRVFADCLDRKKAALVYSLGPRYKQAFLPCERHADGSSAYQFSVGEGSLASTHVVAYHASAVATRRVANAAMSQGALPPNNELRNRENWFAILGSGTEVCYAQGVSDALHLVGGVRALFPILEIVGHRRTNEGVSEWGGSHPQGHVVVIDTLNLIAAVLNSGKDHQRRFLDDECPRLLGHLLRSFRLDFLTLDLVRVLESLVRATLTYELLAIDILRNCLIDLEIWAAAPFNVHAEIWRFTTDLADAKPALVRAATCTRLNLVARGSAVAVGQILNAGSDGAKGGKRVPENVRLGSVDELLDHLRLFYWIEPVEGISRSTLSSRSSCARSSEEVVLERPSHEEIILLRAQVLNLATKLVLANLHADPSSKNRRMTASRVAEAGVDESISHPFIEKLVVQDIAAFFKVAADHGGALSDTCLSMMNLLLDPVAGPTVRDAFARCGGAHALLLIVVESMRQLAPDGDTSKRDSVRVARWLRLLFLFLVDSSKALGKSLIGADAPPPQGGAASTAQALKTVFDSGTQLVGSAMGAATAVGKGVAGIIDTVQNLPQSLGLLGAPLLQASVYDDLLLEFSARLQELCLEDARLLPAKSPSSMNFFISHSLAKHLGTKFCSGSVYRGLLSGMCNRSLPLDGDSPLAEVLGEPFGVVLPQIFSLILEIASASLFAAGGGELHEWTLLEVITAAHVAISDLLLVAGSRFNNREVLASRVDWQVPLLSVLATSGEIVHRDATSDEERRICSELQRSSGRLLRMMLLHAFRHLQSGWAYLSLVWRHVQRLCLSPSFLYGTAIEVLAFAQRERVALLALENTSLWLPNLAFVVHLIEEVMETQAGQEPSMLEMCMRTLDVVTAFQLPSIMTQTYRFPESAVGALHPYTNLLAGNNSVFSEGNSRTVKDDADELPCTDPKVVGGPGGSLSTDERLVDGCGCGNVGIKSLLVVLRYASYEDAARAVQQGLALFPAAFSLIPAGSSSHEGKVPRDRFHGFLHQVAQLVRHFQGVAEEAPRTVLLQQLFQQCIHRCAQLIDADVVRSAASPVDVIEMARVESFERCERRVGEGIRARVLAEVKHLDLAKLSTESAGTNYARQSEALLTQLRGVLVTLDDKRIRLAFIHEEEDATEAQRLWTQVVWELTEYGGIWNSADCKAPTANEHWCVDAEAQDPRSLARQRLRRNHAFDPHIDAVRDPGASLPPESVVPDMSPGLEKLKGLGAYVAKSGTSKDDPFGDEDEVDEDTRGDEGAGRLLSSAEERAPAPSMRQAATTELDAQLKEGIDAEKRARERSALADQSSRGKPFFRAPCQLVTASRLVGGIFEVSRIRIIFTANKNHAPDPFEGLDLSMDRKGVFVTTAHPTMPPHAASSTGVDAPDAKSRRRRYIWRLSALRRVYARRYVMRYTALELFFAACEECGTRGVFFNFLSKEDTRLAARNLVQLATSAQRAYNTPLPDRVEFISPRRRISLASEAAEAWARRELSNFDYLMRLNDLAGRGYNDLAQYPVFPWVLADYESDSLDLTVHSTFRDLSKPMGALSPARLEHAMERFRTFSEDRALIGDDDTPPFMYGTHYSSPGAVLFYLIRLEPFTSMFIDMQGGKFDHADRLFLDVGRAWKNATSAPSDLKELIPEFFYLPEMFKNSDQFDLGTTQGGHKVDDVVLPGWSGGDPHTFVRLHREALESEFVSQSLHHWVDLIFGYKQTGPDAVKAHNVFHHLSYEGVVDIEAITDPGLRASTEATVINFGQTPSRLFSRPHPKRAPNFTLGWPLSLAPDTMAFHAAYPAISKGGARGAISVIHAAPVGRSRPVAGGCPLRLTVVSSAGLMASLSWHPAMREEAASQGSLTTTRSASYRLDIDATPPRAIGAAVHGAEDVGRFEGPSSAVGHARGTPFAVSGNGRLVVSGGHWDGSFRISDVATGRLLDVVCLHRDIVTCVATDGDCVVAGCRDSSLSVWRGVISLSSSFSEGGGTSASSAAGDVGGGPARVWSKALGLHGTDRPAHILRGHASAVLCVRVSVSMDLVISGNGQGALVLHGLRTGAHIRTLWHPDADRRPGVPCAWDQCLLCEAEGLIVAYSHDDLCLRTFSVNGHPLSTCEAGERLRALAVNTLSRGDCVIVAGERTGVSVRRLRDLALLHRYDSAGSALATCLCVTAEESILAGTADGHVAVYSMEAAAVRALHEHLDAQRAAQNSAIVSNAISAAVTGVTGALSSLLTPAKRGGGTM